MNQLQVSIHPGFGAFLQIGPHRWGAPLNADHAEPWFRYLDHATNRVSASGASVADLPEHLQKQVRSIWRSNNPRSTAALFRRCAPDYKGDQWGHMMSVYFNAAAWLDLHGGGTIEGYRPGAGGSVIDDECMADEMQAAGFDEVERLAKFCARLYRVLDRAGLIY